MKKKKKLTTAPKTLKQIQYRNISLPTFRSPLEDGSKISIANEVEHAFFLRCCELYRVLDLIFRTTDKMIETYSKYRSRTQFVETLSFRYFDSEEAMVAKFDPRLAASLFFLFNYLYEMRISLAYTDAMPSTVHTQINDAMLTMVEAWNKLREEVNQVHGWDFKRIPFELPEFSYDQV